MKHLEGFLGPALPAHSGAQAGWSLDAVRKLRGDDAAAGAPRRMPVVLHEAQERDSNVDRASGCPA